MPWRGGGGSPCIREIWEARGVRLRLSLRAERLKQGRRAFLPFFKLEALLSEYERDLVQPALNCERRGINFRARVEGAKVIAENRHFGKAGELTWSEQARFFMDLQCFGQLRDACKRAKSVCDDDEEEGSATA